METEDNSTTGSTNGTGKPGDHKNLLVDSLAVLRSSTDVLLFMRWGNPAPFSIMPTPAEFLFFKWLSR